MLRHIFKFIKDSFQKSIWAKSEELYADFKAVEKVATHFIEKMYQQKREGKIEFGNLNCLTLSNSKTHKIVETYL